MTDPAPGERRVVVVTGGGGGIGAAIADELGRRGDHVVTVDPLVSVDGTEVLPAPEETTAGRILAGGGSAQASAASVTDRDAMVRLAAELVEEHGRIDAMVNVAGITRPTGFARGDEADWSAVLAVHLDGYGNVLHAVLPHMAEAGRGSIVGVTSGSGWRSADAGAYSCAKRAVASLTWELGRAAPAGVAVNAISPIALTRMVTAALGRARTTPPAAPAGAAPQGRSSATGGLSLGSMPGPEELGPLGAWLAGHGGPRVRGEVLFAGGSEVAVVDPPRLLEVVRTRGVVSLPRVCEGVLDALVAAEAAQATTGGANPRLGSIFTEADGSTSAADGEACAVAVISDRPDLRSGLVRRLDAGACTVAVIEPGTVGDGFAAARAALEEARSTLGHLDAVVLAMAGPAPASDEAGWEAVLASHVGLSDQILGDARWAGAVADLSTTTSGSPIRLISVVDATSPGGRSRAQAAAQLSRAADKATAGRARAFAVAMEASGEVEATAALVGELVTRRAALGLGGAELVVGPGWLGVRSHPRPGGSIAFGGPELPGWFGDVLEELGR